MRDAKAFPRQAVEELSRDGLARRESDGVHQPVEATPALAQRYRQRLDLGVAGDIAGKHDLGAEFAGEIGNAVLEALTHVGEGELSAFAPGGFRDAVGDRAVGQQSGHENLPAREESQFVVLTWPGR